MSCHCAWYRLWLVATTASLLVAISLYQYDVNPVLIAIFLIAGLMPPHADMA